MKLKFNHRNKWYMHNPELILESEMHKFSEILRYKQITKFQPDDQTLPIVIGALGTIPKGLVKTLEDLEIRE